MARIDSLVTLGIVDAKGASKNIKNWLLRCRSSQGGAAAVRDTIASWAKTVVPIEVLWRTLMASDGLIIRPRLVFGANNGGQGISAEAAIYICTGRHFHVLGGRRWRAFWVCRTVSLVTV